jgi:hydrogenase maturation protease
MRDLDFGRQLVDCLQQLDWPDGVVVEDLSCAAPLVLHRLQELRPAKVVLLGAVPRDLDPPATLRRYRLDPAPAGPAQVHRSIEASVMGMVDLDHTLAVARHWGGLPVDTVVIEVEPAEVAFGLGFSDDLAACIDPIIDMVREEVGHVAGETRHFDPADLTAAAAAPPPASEPPAARQPSDAMAGLLDYAHDHARARFQSHRAPTLVDGDGAAVPGVALAGRVRPWGVFVKSGGDWWDAIPLDGGGLGIVVGDVDGRGVEVAAAMGDLRAAVRAYAVMEGASPARLVRQLDRLAATTGLGGQARLLYLVLQPGTGEVRFTNAGGCPPLLLEAGGDRFLTGGGCAPLGAPAGADRPEVSVRLPEDGTLLLFTDGLVQSRTVPKAVGMERLRRMAAVAGPLGLEDLCDDVLSACTGSLRRDDDICLLGLRLAGAAVPARRGHTSGG